MDLFLFVRGSSSTFVSVDIFFKINLVNAMLWSIHRILGHRKVSNLLILLNKMLVLLVDDMALKWYYYLILISLDF